jgi:hypothetical protein
MGIRQIEESNYGVYVWLTEDGKIVCDEDRNYLSIQCRKNDLIAIKKIRDEAKRCGVDGGSPLWLSGHRKISDEEYLRQVERMNQGLIPDEYDGPAFIEEIYGT